MPDTPDPRRCALLTIDVQNDVTSATSPIAVPGTDEWVPAMAEIARGFRARALPVVHVVRLYKADGSNAELCRRSLIASGVPLLRPGTEGSQLREELLPPRPFRLDHETLLAGRLQSVDSREWAMYKPRWGAFYETGLAEHLRSLDVDTVAVVGANFPNCPRTTIYEASERDFRIIVVCDAISRAYPQGLEECSGIGARVLTASELLDWLPDPR